MIECKIYPQAVEMTISVSGLVAKAELSVGGLGEAWKKEIDNPLEQVDRSLSW